MSGNAETMAKVFRKVLQVATANPISGIQRQRQHITCAARPKSMIQPLTAENPQGRITATGAPLKKNPQADFCPHRLRLSATTASSQDDSFAVRSL